MSNYGPVVCIWSVRQSMVCERATFDVISGLFSHSLFKLCIEIEFHGKNIFLRVVCSIRRRRR